MPNYCDNTLRIKGNISDISKFVTECLSVEVRTHPYSTNVILEHYLDFNKIVPEPKDIGDNWYDWRLENWGTKWQPCETHFFKINKEKKDSKDLDLTIAFSTAWCPPDKIYNKLIEQYKDTSLEFKVEYYEGGVGFAGHMEFSKGEVTDEEYVEFVNKDKENNIKYYSYLIEYEHESSEWMSEYIQECLEEQEVEDDKIDAIANRFEECYRKNRIEEAATIYVESTCAV